MCNHYQAHLEAMKALADWKAFVESYKTADLEAYGPDIWPRRKALVGRIRAGVKLLQPMIWGVSLMVPGKRSGSTITKHVTNVRNLDSPFWRAMLLNPSQRCLVPFSAFAEPKPKFGREEVWFKVTSEPLSAFAGIWRETEAGPAFAFLTCAPNPLVAPVHPKAMPVILHPEDYDRWLTGADARELAVAFPSQLMALADLS